MFANSMAMVWVPRLEGWLAVPQALPPPPHPRSTPKKTLSLAFLLEDFNKISLIPKSISVLVPKYNTQNDKIFIARS
jgi:hypothetical protein